MYRNKKVTIDERKIVERLRLEKQADEEAERKDREYKPMSDTVKMAGIAFVVFFLVFFGMVVGLTDKPTKYIITKKGGNFGAISQTPFIDDNALQLMIDLMGNLTEYCTLDLDDPAMVGATVGSRSHVNAGWNAVRTALKGDPTNYTEGCYLYGLAMAEARAGAGIGPADMCHGYVHIGIDIFHAVYGFVPPANIVDLLNEMVDRTWPLNFFWRNTGDPAGMKTQAVASAYTIVQCITGQLTHCELGDIDVKELSMAFCNQFFAQDDLRYYNSAYMPWLAFPFPGVLQRSGENVFVQQAQKLLEVTNIIDIVNQSIADIAPLSAIHVVGDVLTTTPAMQLVLDSLFANIPKFYYPVVSAGDIETYLATIDDRLSDIPPGETLLLVARYAQNVDAFNSVDFTRKEYPTPLFFAFSNIIEENDEFMTTSVNKGLINLEIINYAKSAPVMNIVDFKTHLIGYDDNYSSTYRDEKYVAQFIVHVTNPFSTIDMTETIQLLDTFALTNVVIDGRDLGGNIDALLQRLEIENAGGGFGFAPIPYILQTEIEVMDAGVFGSSVELDFPTTFDLRTAYPKCVHPVTDQGSCNDCYSRSVTQAIAERFCQSGKTSSYANMSIAHMTSCSGSSTTNGCVASHPTIAYTFGAEKGVVDEHCFPTKKITCSSGAMPCPEQPCKVSCSNFQHTVFTVDKSVRPYYKVNGWDAIRSDLYHNGAVTTCFYVPTDFYSFFKQNPTGCYSNEATPVKDGHCVVMVKYTPDKMYFRNSLSRTMGDNGDFCVMANMQRVNKHPWFTNEAYASLAGTATVFGEAETIPANNDRDVVLDVNDEPVDVNEPVVVPVTPRPRPPNSGSTLKIEWAVVVVLLHILLLL